MNRPADREAAESAILEAVRRIRFGSVEVTIHDSRVVQIEFKEKLRFQSADSAQKNE